MGKNKIYSNKELGIKEPELNQEKPTEVENKNKETKEKEKVVEPEEKAPEKEVENTEEVKQEDEKEKDTQTPAKEEEKPVFNFVSEINTRLGAEYEDEDSFISSFKTTKEERDALKKANEELEEKYNISLENLDVKNIFANDSLRIQNELVKKYPDKDPALMGMIVNTDLSQMSDRDVLALKIKLDTPGLGTDSQQLEEHIDSKYANEVTLKIEAQQARNELSQLKNIELPSAIDIEKLRNEKLEALNVKRENASKQWKTVVEQLTKDPKISEKYEGTDGTVSTFEYNLGDDSKELIQNMANKLIDMGIDANEQNISTVKDLSESMALKSNLSKILKAHETKVASKLKEETFKDLHNPTVSSDKNTDTQSGYDKLKQEAEAKIIKNFGGSRKTKNLY